MVIIVSISSARIDTNNISKTNDVNIMKKIDINVGNTTNFSLNLNIKECDKNIRK